MNITIEGIKQGRNLAAIRFECKEIPKQVTVGSKRGSKSSAVTIELSEPNPKTADLRQEKEFEHLKELYQDEFTELYTAELAKPSWLSADSEVRKQAATGAAQAFLREK